MDNIATHNTPVWGPKSNFIIRADLANYGMPGRQEQLWARRIENITFEICCIPFFTYGIALGDMVESNDDYTIQKLTAREGHKTLRIAVTNKEKLDQLHEVVHEWVNKIGLLNEWYSAGYLAVDIPPDAGKLDLSPLEQLSDHGEISIEIDE